MEKTKSKGKIGVILVGILIVVLGGVLIWYYQFVVRDQNVFQTAISKAFDYLSSNVMEYDSISGTFAIDVNLTTNDSETKEVLDLLKDIDLAGSYGIDYEQKVMNLGITSQYGGANLLDARLYYENQYAYLYLTNVYDKNIKIAMDNYDELFEGKKSQEDYKVVFNSLEKALKNSLKEEYFTKEKTTLDGTKVTKTTLTLNKETVSSIREGVVTELKNDEKFIKSFATVTDTTEEEVNGSLNDSLNEELGDNTVYVSVYTKGMKNDFVGLEITEEDNKISFYPDVGKYFLEVYENDSLIFNGSILLAGDEKQQEITVSINDVESGTNGDIIINSSVSYNGTISKQDVSNNIDINSISEEEMMDIFTKLSQNEGFVKITEKLGL